MIGEKCRMCPAKQTVSRGLCRACYNVTWRLVESKQISWRKLEAQGIIRKLAPVGRKKGSVAKKLLERAGKK